MRTTLLIFLSLFVACAFASIKDQRKNVKLKPESSQQQVTREQGTTEVRGVVGGVPDRTDYTGYREQSNLNDSETAKLISKATVATGHSAEDLIAEEREQAQRAANAPARNAFGALWAVVAGLLLAAGAWMGLQKYGPKPPQHVR